MEILMSKVKLKRASLDDEATIQSIYRRSPTYFRRVDGSEVQDHFARRDLADGPKKVTSKYEKYFCLIEQDGIPVGVADLHAHHPEIDITYIGLLLLVEEIHGKGLGRKIYREIENFVVEKWKTRRIRLGVSEENNVEGYWTKMGFLRTGHTYLWKGEKHSSTVFEMEKTLDLSPA